MKTLRYLLMVMSVLLLTMTAEAQYTQVSTEHEWQSTSTMQSSGSALPIAAQNGVMLSGNTPGDDSPAYIPGRKPRRATTEDDPFGGGDIGGIDKPEEPGTPVGDGMWVMMILAAGYGAWMMRRIRARRNSGEE